MPDMIQNAGNLLLKWWPVVTAFAVLLVLAVEVRVKVDGLVEDKSIDDAQWEVLRAVTDDTLELNEWRKHVDSVVTVEGMQEWGEIKARVPEIARIVEENRRELDRRQGVIDNFRQYRRDTEQRLRELERATGPR